MPDGANVEFLTSDFACICQLYGRAYVRCVMKKRWSLITAFVCMASAFGCDSGKSGGQVCVYMPDGAPALAMAKLLIEDTKTDGVEYKVVNPALIKTKVTAKTAEDNADFCVLPLTAGSKLLGSGENYKLLATLTHGNLYLVSKNGLSFTADNLSDLIGKTVGVLQLKEVPGITFKTALYERGIPFSELADGVEATPDKVNLRPISSPGDMAVVKADCFLLAEPAVSNVITKGYTLACDVQSLFGGGFPQAVLVAKSRFVEENRLFTEKFLASVEESCGALISFNGETLVSAVTAHLEDKSYATTLNAPVLTAETLTRLGVRFQADCKNYVTEYLLSARAMDAQSVTLPADGFFWSVNG